MQSIRTFFKEYSLVIFFSVLSPFILAPIVDAATEGSVTATVTVTNVSLQVSDGTIAYGSLSTSATMATVSGELDDSQTVTNNGNIAIDVAVKGYNSTGWTLGGTAGSETYTHKTCTTTCDSSPTWTAMTTSYGSDILTGIATSGTADVDFQVGTPTTTTDYTQQSVNVTILATEAS